MPGSRGRVLLVDDKPESVEFVAIELRSAGFEVTNVTSGRAALESVCQDPPDLILLDVMMPGMDGNAVCAALKSDPTTEHIPIVMVTALNDRAHKIRALKNGADEFLTKPTDRSELLARVNSLLRIKQLHDALAGSVDVQRELVSELTQTVERLRAVGEGSLAIVSNLDQDEVLTSIVTRAVQLSGFDDGLIREYDASNGMLSFRAAYGLTRGVADDLHGANQGLEPNGFGMLDYVIRTREPVHLADVEALTPSEEALREEIGFVPRLARWRRLGIRSVLALPLATDELVGLLILHRKTPGEIPGPALKMLEAFAAQSAVAIQNARLFKRLRQERAAIEREQQTLSAIMAGMTDGLLVTDCEKRIRYCNARAAEYLSIAVPVLTKGSLDEVLDQVAGKLSDQSPGIISFREALDRASDRPTFELELAGPPTRNLLALVFPIAGIEGEIDTGILLHDVTQARALTRTKDELLSVVSHELRTPLASLVGFAELLLNREYDENRRREFLTVMYEEGRRLTALINDFLDLQRLESGRQAVHLQPSQLEPLLRHAIHAAGEDQLRPIALDVPEQLPEVDADPDRLHQVLANLLSNARKYSPEGGKIQVSAEASDFGIKVCVRDQGLGVPAEALPHLFQKFYRVDNSDRREITGTGLGLAICRQIVAEHGGSVGAESEGLGRGSSFWFTLTISKPSLQTGDILIVEDDVGFSRLVEAELSNRGFTSVRAANAEAARKVLRDRQPKAIVLDLLLPDMPGEDLLASLVAEAVDHPPVVVSTVKELGPDERQLLESQGVMAIIKKGPRVASLISAAIARALEVTDLPARA